MKGRGMWKLGTERGVRCEYERGGREVRERKGGTDEERDLRNNSKKGGREGLRKEH